MVPAFEAAEMVFVLGSIFWFVGVVVALLRAGERGQQAEQHVVVAS